MGARQKLRGAALGALIGPRVQRLEMRLRQIANALAGRGRRLDITARADDPYSYLLAQLAGDLGRRYAIPIRWIPLPTPTPDVEPEPRLRSRYAVRDCRELARFYDVQFPAAGPEELSETAVERALAMWIGADPEDTEAIREIGAALWSGDELALARAESRWPPREAAETAEILAANARAVRRRGHYQGAMMCLDGLWAWGPDRLHLIERALGGPGPEPLFRQRQKARPDRGPRASPDRVEMFFSFRSPYSYLALEPTFAMADRLGVELVIRPVLPMVMRGMSVPFFKRLYIARDAGREARRLDVPFGRVCDPVGAGVQRCMALFTAAERAGRESELLLSAGRGIWAEALDTADDGDLARIARRAGLELDLSDETWPDRAENNREALFAAGLWGVPSFSSGAFSCWGQDRVWLLEEKITAARTATR